MKKILSVCGLLLIVLLVIVLVRTWLFSASDSVSVPQVSINIDREAVTAHMQQAIRFKTVSTGDQRTQDYDPFLEFVDWVKETYPRVQQTIALEMIADHTMLYKWQGSNPNLKPIMLTGHYDVVPVVSGSEGDWNYPPFAGMVADGYVWGRGAMDDKSGVIVMLEAAALLAREGFVPERTVYLSFGHDEEIGGVAGARGVTEQLKSEGVQLAWSIDEGSFILDGVMPGFDKPIASINVAEKGSMTLDLVAHGPGGHSSMPEAEVSIDILAKALVNLRKHPIPGGLEGVSAETFEGIARNGSFGLRLLVANQWLFGGVLERQLAASSRAADAMLRTTTAPTIINAGVKTNVIPPTATAAVNFRLHPRDTPESVKAHVIAAIDDKRVDVDFRGDGMSAQASTVSSRDSDGYQTIGSVARQVFGDIIVVPGLTVGGTDSKHYSQVADDSYRFQYMLVTSDDIAGFHGTNERVTIDNLVKGTSAYYLLIKEAASR
ncbi:MAG: M20 family peptidase [Oceanicoccus sp.]